MEFVTNESTLIQVLHRNVEVKVFKYNQKNVFKVFKVKIDIAVKCLC